MEKAEPRSFMFDLMGKSKIVRMTIAQLCLNE